METDPASLDPELRTAKLTAIASGAFGLLSLCGGVIPVCGGILGVLGILLGLSSLKVEKSRTAQAGIGISILGLLITIVYMVMLAFKQ
jgi:hypothetical protein